MRFANRKSKSVLATRRDNKGYLYVAPFALGFIFLVLFPMIQSFIYSFKRSFVRRTGASELFRACKLPTRPL